MGLLSKLPGVKEIKSFFDKPKLDYSKSNDLLAAGRSAMLPLTGWGPATSDQAYGNLMRLLQRNGQTDPRVMNRTLSGIQRNTQGNQQALAGNLQGRGYQNSGVGAALMAALGQGGAGQQAGVVAQDASDSEQRRRQDLQLFQQLIGNPAMDYTAMGMGQYNTTKQREVDITRMKMDIFGNLMKGVSGGMG